MNINTSGIVKKLEDKADWVAALLAGYERFDGDIGAIIHNYTSKDFMQNLKWSIKNPKYFLWDSDHLYSSLFKGGAYLYLLAEFGILNAKYKGIATKVMKGAGFAAMTLPGSGEKPSMAHPNYGSGSSGNSPSWGYR